MHQNKNLLIGIISLGTFLEWAEYTFYGYMAITLSTLFFPEGNSSIGILKTFGIFAVGYLMRPFGAILFGHIGDKVGRKPALSISLLLMGVATFGIGCLPTYQQIGITAPLILLLLRMLQGIAISGEYNGAGIFLVEKADPQYPALAGSWVSASAAAGMVIGGVAALIISLPQAPIWAWRIPFILGGLSCFLGIWLRNKTTESPLFNPYRHPRNETPLLNVLKKYKKSLILTASIAAFTCVYVYIGNIYIVVFLKQQVGLSTHQATFFAIFGEIIVALFIPLMGFVADKTNPYRQYRLGLLLATFGTPCFFILAATGNYVYIATAMLIYGIVNAIVCGPMVKILYDQFPPALRYTGISFAWSVSAAIFGGTAPIVAHHLTTQYEWSLAPSFYVSLIALFTFCIFGSILPKTTLTFSMPLKELTD